jgi:hypothetical protein
MPYDEAIATDIRETVTASVLDTALLQARY